MPEKEKEMIDELWVHEAENELLKVHDASWDVIDVVTSLYGAKEEIFRDLLMYYTGNSDFDFEENSSYKPSEDDFEDEWEGRNNA